jgi:coatomer subunit zeta
MESDVMMYVVGGVDENEVLLYNVILALRDSLHLLFKQSVDNPTIIVQRVSKAPAQDTQLGRIDLSEQGVNNLAQFGKAKLADWLRQGL